ncbi:MAG: hypothetical protein LBQ33_02790, partial [Oscillospiraceae bacterium]|nr:hypothetical protein [Oscillospiraceae bacterium]
MDWVSVLSFFEEKGIAILNVFVCILAFIVNPFISLFNPPLPAFTPSPEPPPALVAKQSIADFVILYGTDATVQEINAATILADYLFRITGQTFSVFAEDAAPENNAILVGKTTRTGDVDYEALGAEGYLIRPQGNHIVITGGAPRGVLYGVHRFLEKYFDCHWYAATSQVIPKGPAAIAQVQEEVFVPALEYRETDWLSPRNQTYALANRLNGNMCSRIPDDLGGNMGYSGSFAHTIINQFLRPDEFFEAHPAWYAYREDSKSRVPQQLCLTNPEVLAEMIREV